MEKDNHLALSRLMKSIEILRKEECSNPLILSENIKMLLDQYNYCNKNDDITTKGIMNNLRQILDYFDGTTSPYIDYFDKTAEIAKDKSRSTEMDFINLTEIKKLDPSKRYE